MAFNIAQLPSLKELLESVSGRKILMPTRHKLMKSLDEEFGKVNGELKKLLAQQEYLCITADVWSSRAQSYLGVTVHFLNDKYQRESFVLAFRELKGKQTYFELANMLDQIFKEYSIKKSQITNIVTDGGSAFCKMFKKYGDSIDVIVTNTNGDEIEESNSAAQDGNIVVTEFMEGENGEMMHTEILNFDGAVGNSGDDVNNLESGSNAEIQNYIGNDVPVPEHRIELPAQRRCVSHLLNLVSKDFDKNLTGIPKTILCAALEKLHTIWMLTHQSSMAKNLCKSILGKVLNIPCETRWNSKYDAIKTCLEPKTKENFNKLIEKLQTNIRSVRHLQL